MISNSPRPGGRRGPLLRAATGYLLALGLTGLVFLGTRAGQRLDGRLATGASQGGGYPGATPLAESGRAVLSIADDPLVVPDRARGWLAGPGAAVVSAVAAATMVAGWHRFSDTVGGLLLASGTGCLAAALARRPGAPVRAAAGRRGGIGWVGGLAAVTGALLPCVATAVRAPAPGPVIAVAVAGGCVGLWTLSVLAVLRRSTPPLLHGCDMARTGSESARSTVGAVGAHRSDPQESP